MLTTLLGLAAMMCGLDIPHSRCRPPRDAVAQDLENETAVEMLLRRLRDSEPWPKVDALTDAHLRGLFSR